MKSIIIEKFLFALNYWVSSIKAHPVIWALLFISCVVLVLLLDYVERRASWPCVPNLDSEAARVDAETAQQDN